MGTITIKLPDELERNIREFKLDWSDIARRAIVDRAEKLKKLKRFSFKIEVPEKTAKEFTDNISESLAKRFKEE